MDENLEIILENQVLNLVLEDSEELTFMNDTPTADGITKYEGSYEFTSSLYDDIEAETNGKLMKGNILVHPIPIFEVENPQGGTTVTIGA